jgi:hypothetical protein
MSELSAMGRARGVRGVREPQARSALEQPAWREALESERHAHAARLTRMGVSPVKELTNECGEIACSLHKELAVQLLELGAPADV